MSKYKKLSYNQCVERAKDLIKDRNSLKYEICELTLRVCDIKRGGHAGKVKYYTIKDFAKDIGIVYGTLEKWLLEHRRVVKKIGIKNPNKEDYKIIKEVVKRVKQNTPTKEVKKVYSKVSKFTKEDYSLLDAIKRSKVIRNFCQDTKLSELNQDDLDLLLILLEQSVDAIKNNR